MLSVNRFKSALLVGVLGLGLLTACATPTVSGSEPGATRNTLTVTGNGSAFGKPDVATIQIGVQTRNADAGVAVDENTRRMNALMEALKALGIAENDLQTANFSVYAQQDYDPATGQPRDTITYMVDNTLTVTLRDVSKLGDTLSQAVSAGANNVYGISFSVANPTQLEAEAREKAMADARVRAEALAKTAGVTLGGPISITEYTTSVPPVYPVAEARAGLGGGAVPVSTGQLQINLQVSVTYEIQ